MLEMEHGLLDLFFVDLRAYVPAATLHKLPALLYSPQHPRPPPPIRYHDLAKAKLANLPASHANETVVSDGMPHLVQIQTRMAFLAFLVRRSPLTYVQR